MLPRPAGLLPRVDRGCAARPRNSRRNSAQFSARFATNRSERQFPPLPGRVAVQHVNKQDESKNFAFKCHRENNDIYAVNCIAFHPTFGTFATTGSDGTFNFWDKEARQRLKQFNKACSPIPVGAFNREGNIFAYAVSYDWSKGSEHYNPRTNHLLLHPVPDTEIKSRSNQKKPFGGRR